MRIAFLLEYLGKSFSGSQAQKSCRTVQNDLEHALAVYFRLERTKKTPRVHLSGRTDAGVHATGQVAHFDIPEGVVDLDNFNPQMLAWGLNGILAADLSVRRIAIAPEGFHARYTAIQRQYIYRILNSEQRSPLKQNTHFFLRGQLDVKAMQEAILCLPGRHDFSAFKSSNADKVSSICQVDYAKLLNLGEGELEFSIAADHFVYNMIRIIVGTLVEIGLKKRDPESLKMALMSKRRNQAGPTAPAYGLCLVSVKYPPPYANIFAQKSKPRKGDSK